MHYSYFNQSTKSNFTCSERGDEEDCRKSNRDSGEYCMSRVSNTVIEYDALLSLEHTICYSLNDLEESLENILYSRPDFLVTQDEDGATPLLRGIISAELSDSALRSMISRCPESITIQDDEGMLIKI